MSKMTHVVLVGGHDQACNISDLLHEEKGVSLVLCVSRNDDNGQDGNFRSFKKHCKSKGYSYFEGNNTYPSREHLDCIRATNPDIIISIENNMLFGQEYIDLMSNKLGILNLHYSPLPKYAGYWPEMWAIWNKEKSYGVTFHQVSRDIDDGPIIAQKLFNIGETLTRYELYQMCAKESYLLFKELLPAIVDHKLPLAVPQDKQSRTYYRRGMPNDGFIDLEWDKETMERLIRAVAYPGFPGPKVRIGKTVYTLVEEDLPFFGEIMASTRT